MVDLKKIDRMFFVSWIPLSNKIKKDFYFAELESMGISIVFCEISRCFSMGEPMKEGKDVNNEIYFFNNWIEFDSFLQEEVNENSLFVPLISCIGKTIRLFRLFTKHKCQLCIFCRDMNPTFRSRDNYIGGKASFIIKLLTSKTGWFRLCEYINNASVTYYKKFNIIKGYDVVFESGFLGRFGIGIIGPKEFENAQIIEVNSSNYERAMAVQSSTVKRQRYILFIDQYYPLHPDAGIAKYPPISSESYYKNLNSYFSRIEQKFKMPVIIAAHPKAERYKTEDFFCNREVYFDKTEELCSGANIVLTHGSTAVSYAIFFNKRVHMLSFKELYEKRIYSHLYTTSLADLIGCNWQFFDDDSDINVIETINVERYRHYKYNYLTSPESENKRSIDIIRNAFGR